MMIRNTIATILVASFMCGMANIAVADDKEQYQFEVFEVQIRGFLKKPTEKVSGSTQFIVRSRNIDVYLDVHDKEQIRSLDDKFGQLVEFRGSLLRLNDGKLMCSLKGAVTVVKLTEYLIGYEPEKLGEIKKQLSTLGMTIRDDHQPGKYLVAIPGLEWQDANLQKLKSFDGVRYVEENQKVSIKSPQ